MVLIPFNYKRKAGSKPQRGSVLAKKQRAKPRKKIPFRYKKGAKATVSRIKNVVNSMAETKYSPLTSFNENTGYAIQTGARASMYGFVLGDKPSAWTSDFQSLGGVVIEKGLNGNQRDGDYVHLNKCHFNLNIDMRFTNDNRCPFEFRIIHFRQRRNAMPAGVNPDPGTSLFLGINGGEFGHDTGLVNGTDLMMQPLNKRSWIIYRDERMIMEMPARGQANNGAGVPRFSNGYKVTCNRTFNFYFNKKVRYTTSNVPENIAYHHAVVIYCRPIDKDLTSAAMWEVNTRGTTTFTDI